MKYIIMGCIWILMIPTLIANMNLKLTYKINTLLKEIKEYEKENAYLKKMLYQKTTLTQIQKRAFKIGFQIPDPQSIVIISEENFENLFADNKFIKNFKNLFSSTN